MPRAASLTCPGLSRFIYLHPSLRCRRAQRRAVRGWLAMGVSTTHGFAALTFPLTDRARKGGGVSAGASGARDPWGSLGIASPAAATGRVSADPAGLVTAASRAGRDKPGRSDFPPARIGRDGRACAPPPLRDRV